MNGNTVFDIIDAIVANINLHKDEIEKLDQSIGDGDHVFNLLRGLNAISSLRCTLANEDIRTLIKQIALKIMSTVGGSSGALFSTLLINMAKNINETLPIEKNMSKMFYYGVVALKERGKAEIGDKTMLDVFLPVSEEFYDLTFNNTKNFNNIKIAKKLISLSNKKMLGTKNMLAKKGRASYLGKRSLGHIDPGARSAQLIIKTICNYVIKSYGVKNEKVY